MLLIIPSSNKDSVTEVIFWPTQHEDFKGFFHFHGIHKFWGQDEGTPSSK